MSNFVGYALKAGKSKTGQKVISKVKDFFTGGSKTTGTESIKNVPISPNLKKFQEQKEEVIQTTDKYTKGLTEEGKTNVRKYVAPALSKISKLTQKFPVKKAKGGRVGYKKGTPNPFLRKSNKKKIEEAFKATTPFMVKKDKPKKRLMAKKGSPDPKKKKKFPDLTGDGKVTFADILKGRGVINGKKKKTKKKII